MCTTRKLCQAAHMAAVAAREAGKPLNEGQADALAAARAHEFVPEGFEKLINAHVIDVYMDGKPQGPLH